MCNTGTKLCRILIQVFMDFSLNVSVKKSLRNLRCPVKDQVMPLLLDWPLN